MAKKDPRIDAYIDRAEPFARPILKHLRNVVHRGCPDVVETVKWSFPHFEAHGGVMASMAAFKKHCAFGFWKGSLLGIGGKADGSAPGMGSFGRIETLGDLPSEKRLLSYVKKAAELNAKGVKIARAKPVKGRKVTVPSFFARALGANEKARAAFDGLSPSRKREYVDWLTQAKAAETREKRLKTALLWLAQGKNLNWKYERK